MDPLILTFSHLGRRDLNTPSPLMGEGWGECCSRVMSLRGVDVFTNLGGLMVITNLGAR